MYKPKISVKVQQTVPTGTYEFTAPSTGVDNQCNNSDWRVKSVPGKNNTVLNTCSLINESTCNIPNYPDIDNIASWAAFNNDGIVNCTYNAEDFKTIDQVNAFCSFVTQNKKTDPTTDACTAVKRVYCSNNPKDTILCPLLPIPPEPIIIPITPIISNTWYEKYIWVIFILIILFLILIWATYYEINADTNKYFSE